MSTRYWLLDVVSPYVGDSLERIADGVDPPSLKVVIYRLWYGKVG